MLQREDGFLFVGVLRGTSQELQAGGKKFLIDNSKIQVHQGRPYFNTFAPASEVPARVEQLLKKINSIRDSTDLVEIFELYRDFIKIHPFIDANGRTGRMLLNFMLLKAGFPYMSEPSESLFWSADQLVELYINKITPSIFF